MDTECIFTYLINDCDIFSKINQKILDGYFNIISKEQLSEEDKQIELQAFFKKEEAVTDNLFELFFDKDIHTNFFSTVLQDYNRE